MVEKVRVSEGGRVVIPAELRRELGIAIGDEVLIELQDGELRIFTLEHAIRHAQELVAPFVPQDRSLADELIAERRAEAARE